MNLARRLIDLGFATALAIALAAPPDALAQRKPAPPSEAPAVPTVEDFVLAVVNDRVGEVRALLKYGLDPNTVGRDGFPVLVTAAREGSAGAMDALLDAGANVDIATVRGDTALMIAAARNVAPMIGLLIQAGAKTDLKSAQGQTAADIADQNGAEAAAKALKLIGKVSDEDGH